MRHAVCHVVICLYNISRNVAYIMCHAVLCMCCQAVLCVVSRGAIYGLLCVTRCYVPRSVVTRCVVICHGVTCT